MTNTTRVMRPGMYSKAVEELASLYNKISIASHHSENAKVERLQEQADTMVYAWEVIGLDTKMIAIEAHNLHMEYEKEEEKVND